MRKILTQYGRFLYELCQWQYVPLYVIACGATYILIMSGFDWAYFIFAMHYVPRPLLFIADLSGTFTFVFLPIVLLTLVHRRKRMQFAALAHASAYAIILAFSVSTFIKCFTGRVSPPDDASVFIDNSHAFQFGFMREQIIGGWPSSHTTIAFALATALCIFYFRTWYARVAVFSAAFFIGIGVTLGFHWFSEFIAGALLGIAIGHVVGQAYRKTDSSH